MKTKVVIVIESLSLGGAEKALISLLHYIDYSNYSVTVKVIADGGMLIDSIPIQEDLNVEVILQSKYVFLKKLKSKFIYKWLPTKLIGDYLTNGYEIAIAFCEGFSTKWIAATSNHCSKIAWVHTDLQNFNWPEQIGVYKSHHEHIQTYHKFANIVAVSNQVADRLNTAFGCSGIRTIYNILDPNIHQLSREAISDFEVKNDRFKLVSVGRHELVKGFDILLDAIAHLPVHIKSRIHLYLIGDGSQHTALLNKVNELKLSNSVTFTGNQSNPYKFMAIADLYVCPSREEGFNIALLEAMSLAKPVIATNCAGPCEILTQGKYGMLTNATPEALAQAISSLYSDTQRLQQLSDLSIERSLHFNYTNQIAKFHNVLETSISH